LISKQEQLDAKIKSEINNGAILPHLRMLEAEKLKRQQLTEIKFVRKKHWKSFVLTASTINNEVTLVKPVLIENNTVNNRPELQLFDLQNEQIEISKQFQNNFTPSKCIWSGGLRKSGTKYAR
jgi:hypothetical protein